MGMARHDIEITEGIGERTSRIGLKKKMMAFGAVDACHMGNRGTELPLVRFKTLTAAEAALNALKACQVFLDGAVLKGEWRGTTHVKKIADPSRKAGAEHGLTSRDILNGRDADVGARKSGSSPLKESSKRSRKLKRSRSHSGSESGKKRRSSSGSGKKKNGR